MRLRLCSQTVAVHAYDLELTQAGRKFILGSDATIDGYSDKGVEYITLPVRCTLQLDVTPEQLSRLQERIRKGDTRDK